MSPVLRQHRAPTPATTQLHAVTPNHRIETRRACTDCNAWLSAYNLGERCYACADRRLLALVKRGNQDAPPVNPRLRHGTRSRYQAGCRCHQCGWVNAEYHRRWREQREAREAER